MPQDPDFKPTADQKAEWSANDIAGKLTDAIAELWTAVRFVEQDFPHEAAWQLEAKAIIGKVSSLRTKAYHMPNNEKV
jgi:hypothetical protein